MPSSRILLSADPSPGQAAVRAVELELFAATNSEFRAELTQVDLRRLWTQRGWENLPRVFHSVVHTNRAPIAFLADTDPMAKGRSGTQALPGVIIIDGPRATQHDRSPGSCRGSMSLRLEDLSETSNLNGRELAAAAITRLVRPAPALMGRLLSLHENAVRLAKAAPARPANGQAVRDLEQALARTIIRCLTGVPLDVRVATRRHASIIARLEHLLAANHYRPLYLAEISAATGVSERTLRVCCKEHLGMGPVRYLWLRRMHLARAALLHGDPARASVTGIATDHGFWELGRFSVEYRTLFGESPSASLRRMPESRCATTPRPFTPEGRNLHSAYQAASS